MHYNKAFLFSAMLLLAACRDPGQGAQTDSPAAEPMATSADPAQPVVTEAAHVPAERRTTFASPIAGGITTFTFPYHVSIDREVARKGTGQKSREIGVEFFDSIVVDVDKAVASEFQKAGFKIAAREEQGKAVRTVYSKKDHGDVLVWVRPGAPRGDRFKLQFPNATGTVYMAWDIEAP